jgi:hypothetical protein
MVRSAWYAVVLSLCCACVHEVWAQQDWADRRRANVQRAMEQRAVGCNLPGGVADSVRCVGQLPDSLRREMRAKLTTLVDQIDYRRDDVDVVVVVSGHGLVSDASIIKSSLLPNDTLRATITEAMRNWSFVAGDIPREGVAVYTELVFVNHRRRQRVGVLLCSLFLFTINTFLLFTPRRY